MKFFTLLLAPLFISTVCAEITIENEDQDSFSVYLDNVMVMRHTKENPMFSVGIGDTFEAVESEGNYDITDTVAEIYQLDQFLITEDGPDFNLTLFTGSNSNIGLTLTLSEPTPGEMTVDPDYFAYENQNIDRFYLRLPAEDDEQIWGGGEQYTYLDLRRGPTYPVWVREQGFIRDPSSPYYPAVEAENPGSGGDYHTTYWPQPAFLSSRHYYFQLDLPTYSELRLAPREDSSIGHEVYWHRTPVEGVYCPDCGFKFVVRESLLDIVKVINPGQPPLPEWVYNGAIIGVQGGTETMLQILAEADQYDAAVSGMWIQDWSGKIVTDFGTRVFWNWRWNETWYPDLDIVIQDLADRDVKVLAYITGHLNIDGDVYQAAEDEDYWLTTDSGERLLQDFGEFIVSTVDLMEPDPNCNCVNPARDYYKSLMSGNLLDLGIAGWMADFGEYTPTNARSKNAHSWWGEVDQEEVLHQTYSQEWAKLNREVLEETGKLEDTLFFMRSGGTRSKDYQQMSWAGDQTVDWSQSDGLPSSIVAALSLACMGMGTSHSDIGGYTGDPDLGLIRSKELLLRWAEYSAFTPLMRTHEGNHPEENHQIYSDEDTWLQFARLTKLYKALSPYTRSAVAGNSDLGVPAMRPIFLDYESDPGAYSDSNQYEYIYGPDLLVAPVIEEGVEEREVYLPGPQTWVYFWDIDEEIELEGPMTVTVPAPVGQTPVFYKYETEWRNLFRTIAIEFAL